MVRFNARFVLPQAVVHDKYFDVPIDAESLDAAREQAVRLMDGVAWSQSENDAVIVDLRKAIGAVVTTKAPAPAGFDSCVLVQDGKSLALFNRPKGL